MSNPLDDVEVHLVDSFDEAQNFMAWLGEVRPWLGFDIETSGFNLGRDQVRLVQFGDAKTGWAIPWFEWGGVARDAFARYRERMVAHNALFDTRFLKREGIDIPQHLLHDTYVMSHLLDPRRSSSLEASAARWVDKLAFAGKNAMKDAFAKQGWDHGTVPPDFPGYWVYACMDTVLTALLAENVWDELQPYMKVYEVELACIRALRDAGCAGMAIDLDYCHEHLRERTTEMTTLSQRIPIDPKKDRDIYELLSADFEGEWPKTKKNHPKTDDAVLKALALAGKPYAEDIRKWRKAETFAKYFLGLIDQQVHHVVYPSVKVLGARTGRMSVTEPALQTVPRGPEVRGAFVSRPSTKLVLADYEQLELRVLAAFAKETAMLEAFARGDDLHTWVASNVYNVPPEDVTRDQRGLAKNAQFARVYGAGEEKIAATAGVQVAVVADFMARYGQMFPRIGQFMHDTMIECKGTKFDGDDRTGYVMTVLGRRLPVEKEKIYASVNYLIQSSATADLLKVKIVELANAGLGDFLRLPVHDELIFEVPDTELDDAMATITDVMPENKMFDVPCTIDGPYAYGRWSDKYANE